MADTKLTREWVDRELKICTALSNDPHYMREELDKRAALCRHYLATEQDARDAVDLESVRKHEARAADVLSSIMGYPGMREYIGKILSDRAHAALAQKESPT